VGHAVIRHLGRLGWLVALIAIATILSGAVQVMWPALVLGIVGGETGVAAKHFFGIVGMFMVLFGGLALHGVFARSRPALFWCGLQKVGAVAAVALGIRHGVFSRAALPVAGFDLASAVVLLLYWKRLARGAD
jgi:hypothetical protein